MGNTQWTTADEQENAICWLTNDKEAEVTFHQKRFVNKIKKMAQEHDDVRIIAENKDGSIVARLPVKSIKVSYPVTHKMSDEQKQLSVERLARYRQENSDR